MAKKNEEVISEGKLNVMKVQTSDHMYGNRKRRRIVFNYEDCVSQTEQQGRYDSDINYLVKKFQPDELAAYIAARNRHRQEIYGHDFSQEPSLQEAKNKILAMQKEYEKLPDELKRQFPHYVDFLKFLDSEKNVETFERLGLLTKEEIDKLRGFREDERKAAEAKQAAEDERIMNKIKSQTSKKSD